MVAPRHALDALRVYYQQEGWWLDDYSLYRALRAQAGERSWTEWPAALRDRDPSALAEASRHLAEKILFYQYVPVDCGRAVGRRRGRAWTAWRFSAIFRSW